MSEPTAIPIPFRAPAGSARPVRAGVLAWPEPLRKHIADDLRAALEGEVRFDGASRALYGTAGSNYRQIPIGVVIPRSVEDVIAAVRVAREHGVPILSRGGGTSLAGQCCNVALVIDFSKYLNKILSLDPERRIARVQPGLILDHLRTAAERHHLTFGPDPSTHDHCTLGGMIGNNSCGVHSVMAGKTDVNVEELDILLYDGTRMRVGPTSDDEFARIVAGGGRRGQIYASLLEFRERYAEEIRQRYPDIPRRVSGFNLPWLLSEHGAHVARALVGSEGTCVTVLEATVRLVPSPPARTLVALGYDDVYLAADDVPRVMQFGPIGLEGMDDRLVNDIKHIGVREDSLAELPRGGGWLLAEFGGETRDEADARAHAMVDGLSAQGRAPRARVFDDRAHEEQIWKTREAGLGATAHVTSDHPTWEGWEDSAVPPERLGQYLRDFRKLLDRFHYIGDFYGHFGQGCLHTRINFDLMTAAGIATYRSFISEASDLVVSHGGSLSGEHGDGQSRAEMLPKMFGAALIDGFREFKRIWDPDGLMNPGKVVDPYKIDENLRYGTDYAPIQVATHFAFSDEHGDFSRATMRCVGVGECRRTDRGTMCPSFQVTREEKHSTRGRARLLWEMLEKGDPVGGVWQNEDVREALDLCLACKGCKGQCPVHVDMATYKAEFLSHYFEQHWRPRSAWAFGLIHWWARVASRIPTLVNAATRTRGLATLAKVVAGVGAEREIPAFADETFLHWFQRRPSQTSPDVAARPRVLLWPDTFNNAFHPETAIAATELLESAGFEVIVPQQPVCCGRPLYDYGLLTLAKTRLRALLEVLRQPIRAGIPVVVLEPSCASVLKDELMGMLPADQDARRLGEQTYLLGEFVRAHRDRFVLPQVSGRALYHAHCHQQALFETREDIELLRSTGLAVDAPDSGCCGMAGGFGFEADHVDISRRIGERVLLPAVRAADDSTLIVTDGFSCREQVEQTTPRRALHLAQVLRAIQVRDGVIGPPRPEATLVRDHGQQTAQRLPAMAAAALVVAGIGMALAFRPEK